MATHSSILAWRIPWTEEPGGLQSMGSQSQKRPKQLGMYAHTSFQRAGQESLNTSPRDPGFCRKYAAAFGSYK